jgi:hypothetical protein
MYTIRARYLTNSYAMHCMWVAWSWRGNVAANAVEYGTELDGIVHSKQYATAFRNMARPNIAAVAYRTRTVCNTVKKTDYWYYYREGAGTTRSGSNLLWYRDDRRRINGSVPKKRVRAHCESTIVVTVLA